MLVFIDFPSNSRDVPWEDIFKLGASVVAAAFCKSRLEFTHISLTVNIRCYSSTCLSAAFAAAIAHRIHFLPL